MNQEDIRQSSAVKPKVFYGYIVVTAGFFILLVSFGFFSSFGVFFKPILADFGWTRAPTSGAFALSFIVQGILGTIIGSLTNRFGSRILVTFCGILIALGYILMSQINSIWQLYLYYGVIIGAGMGGVFVPLLATTARWFDKRRSLMTGIVVCGLGVGSFITPPITNWLIDVYDWRTSFIVEGVIILVVIVLAAQFLRRDPAQMRLLPDGEEKSRPGSESRKEGISLRDAIHTKAFWITFVIFFCVGFYAFLFTVHIVPYATDIGISAITATTILATFGGLSLVGRVIWGIIADRTKGNRKVYILGFALMLAVTALPILDPTELWALYAYAAIFGFVYSGAGSLTSPLVAELFGMRSHALIFGIVDLGFPIGGAVGPIVGAYIFDIMGNYQLSFLICAAISALGLFLALIIRTPKGPLRKDSRKGDVLLI
jgi:MFS family permease